MYYTKNTTIELQLPINTVRLINYRKTEHGRVYLLNAKRLYQVMQADHKKQIVPTYGEDKCVSISFSLAENKAGKHIASANDGINTYISHIDYADMMQKLKEGLDDQFS